MLNPLARMTVVVECIHCTTEMEQNIRHVTSLSVSASPPTATTTLEHRRRTKWFIAFRLGKSGKFNCFFFSTAARLLLQSTIATPPPSGGGTNIKKSPLIAFSPFIQRYILPHGVRAAAAAVTFNEREVARDCRHTRIAVWQSSIKLVAALGFPSSVVRDGFHWNLVG